MSFPGSGFLLHGGTIVAIVLPIVRDEGPVYDAVDGLIDGVDLASSSRDEVRAVLGEPYETDGNLDLFRIQDQRVVHMTFDEGLIWQITVMARDVSER